MNIRQYSTGTTLTHINDEGHAKMVDVSKKSTTFRTATAQAQIKVGSKIASLIKENNIKKGDVLTVSQLAGIMAAKKTSELIPLCHNIVLNSVNVTCQLNELDESVYIMCIVKCDGKTGAEMEALTAVTVAALTVYDMCKAVSHDMVISDVKLMEKTGGMSGDIKKNSVMD